MASSRLSADKDEYARLVAAGAILLLTLCILLRLWNFAGGRSLWHDEAMVSLSVTSLPLGQLMGQLEFDQMAPVGWLGAEKLAYTLWPNVDYGLRLVALLAGIASVLFFWRLARGILTTGEAFVATALFGLCSALVRYSAMVKPYIFDALVAVVMLWLSARLLRDGEARIRRTLLLGVVGLAAIPFVFAGIFVMASSGIVLFAFACRSGDRRWLGVLTAVGLAWLLLLVALFAGIYTRQTTTVSNMTDLYWGGAFAPAPVNVEALRWYVWRPFSVLSFLADGLPPLLVAIAAGIGVAAFIRSTPWIAALLIAPIIVSLAASGAHAFPFESRFQLCLAAPLFLLVARGLGAVARLAPRRGILASLIGVAMVVPLVGATAREARRSPPWSWEEVRPNLELLARERRPGDLVWVSPAAERPLLIYAPKLGLNGLHYSVAPELQTDPACALRDIDALPARGRLWLVTYHLRSSEDAGRAKMIDGLKAHGDVRMIGDEPGSKLYRVDLATASNSPATVPSHCFVDRKGAALLARVAAARGLTPEPVAALR